MINFEAVYMLRATYLSEDMTWNIVLKNNYDKINSVSMYDELIDEIYENTRLNLRNTTFENRPDVPRFNSERSEDKGYPNNRSFRVALSDGNLIDVDIMYAFKINDRYFELEEIPYVDNYNK